jgi:hypothetical protein
MIRRRAAAAGIAAEIGCHTFRATGITAYLSNGGALEHAQEMAAHESPRTTKLYDRTKERLTQDEVERIRLGYPLSPAIWHSLLVTSPIVPTDLERCREGEPGRQHTSGGIRLPIAW